MDPFFGKFNDPLTLHKYLYANGDPVSHGDPLGLFSLAGSLINMTISSMLMSTLAPVIEPIFSMGAALLIPRPVLNFLQQPLSAFMLGANFAAGASYFLSGGLVGGVELLLSPNTGSAALYTFAGLSAGIGLSKGVYGGVAPKVGVVVGARRASEYEGPFLSLTLAFSDLPWSVRKPLIRSMRDLLMASTNSLINSGFLLWPSAPNSSVFLGKAMKIVNQIQRLSVTVSWVPGVFYPVAASFEYNLGVGKGSAGLISMAKTSYTLRTPDVNLA